LNLAENPIYVKKEPKFYLTTREEFFAKNSNKILDKKGFVFSTHKTDKERINEFLKNKAALEKYHNEINAKKPKQINVPSFIQPSMRFKARTDFERVLEQLHGNKESFNREKNKIKKQLQKINGDLSDFSDNSDYEEYLPKKKNEDDKNDNINDDEELRKKNLHNKIIQDRKAMLKKRKFLVMGLNRRIDNSQARYIRGDLHNKTHFKAMENLTMFKTSTMDHNIFKQWSKEDIDQQKNLRETKINFYTTITNGFKKNGIGFNNTLANFKSQNTSFKFNKNNETSLNTTPKKIISKNKNVKNFNLFGNKKILNDLEITKEIAKSNPLLFNINFNSIKTDINNIQASNDEMDNLKRLAFEIPENDENNDDSKDFQNLNYKNEAYDEFKKEENIFIDGQEFKKSETDKIADKILKKINYNEKKKKINSKLGQGKLMFTGGLTLNQFELKYGLLP
jgi:hypothetical protein